jgi:erythrin-vacuolar iron transport family protein
LAWARFYRKAAQSARDSSIRELLDRLADAEDEHESFAHKLGETILTKTARAREDETSRRLFVLRYVQPGLAGLMDGSVSTLAPLFAAAFATHNPWQTFLVGIAASVGAGISMAFAEALSDDGSLTGRGAPVLRGVVCGAMTTAGGLGHTLPYLIPDFFVATVISICVVAAELAIISFIRHRFRDTPFLAAAFQSWSGAFWCSSRASRSAAHSKSLPGGVVMALRACGLLVRPVGVEHRYSSDYIAACSGNGLDHAAIDS